MVARYASLSSDITDRARTVSDHNRSDLDCVCPNISKLSSPRQAVPVDIGSVIQTNGLILQFLSPLFRNFFTMASSQVRNRLNKMKEDLDNNNEVLTEIEDKNKQLDAQIIGLEAEEVSSKSKLLMVEKRLETVEQEQTKVNSDNNVMLDQLSQKDQEVNLLEGEQDVDDNRKTSLEEESKELADSVSKAEIILEDHRRRLTVLAALVEKREDESDKIQEKIDKTKEELERAVDEIKDLEQDEVKLSENECILRDELKEITVEYLDVDGQCETITRQITSLQHEVEERSKKLDMVETEFEKEKEAMSEFENEMKEI